eukprot:g9160.t1
MMSSVDMVSEQATFPPGLVAYLPFIMLMWLYTVLVAFCNWPIRKSALSILLGFLLTSISVDVLSRTGALAQEPNGMNTRGHGLFGLFAPSKIQQLEEDVQKLNDLLWDEARHRSQLERQLKEMNRMLIDIQQTLLVDTPQKLEEEHTFKSTEQTVFQNQSVMYEEFSFESCFVMLWEYVCESVYWMSTLFWNVCYHPVYALQEVANWSLKFVPLMIKFGCMLLGFAILNLVVAGIRRIRSIASGLVSLLKWFFTLPVFQAIIDFIQWVTAVAPKKAGQPKEKAMDEELEKRFAKMEKLLTAQSKMLQQQPLPPIKPYNGQHPGMHPNRPRNNVNRGPAKKSQYKGPTRRMNEVRCDVCNAFGHSSENCNNTNIVNRDISELKNDPHSSVNEMNDTAVLLNEIVDQDDVMWNKCPSSESDFETASNAPVGVVTVNAVTKQNRKLLGKHLKLDFSLHSKQNSPTKTRALIDTGSCVNLISEKTLKKLGYTSQDIWQPSEPLMLHSFNGKKTRTVGHLEIRTRLGRRFYDLTYVVTPEELPNPIIGIPGLSWETQEGDWFKKPVNSERQRGSPNNKKLFLLQKYESENAVRPVVSTGTVRFPLGKTAFLTPHKWKRLHLPWAIKGDLAHSSLFVCLMRREIQATVVLSQSGYFYLDVFNASNEPVRLPARTHVILLHYDGLVETQFLVRERGSARKQVISAVSPIDKFCTEFEDVFDEEASKVTPAMRSLRVKFPECKYKGPVKFGGCRTPIKIDSLVPLSRIKQEIASFTQKGFIERVRSSEGVFLSPIFFLQKKQPGKIRCLNDYRALNCLCDFSDATFLDVQRTIREIDPCWTCFTKLDISNAFFSIPLDSATSRLFGFNLFNETYVWKVVPQGFGLSPVWFVERLRDILHGLPVIVYADDCLIGTVGGEEHDRIVEQVLKRFSKFGLKLNRNKIIHKVQEVDFLGYTIRAGSFDLQKYLHSKSVQLPELKHYKQLERLLGALNFCRSHVFNLSQITESLQQWKNRAQRSKHLTEVDWGVINREAATVWKRVTQNGVSLALNDSFDSFELKVDWSGTHRGYILYGRKTDKNIIVAVGSEKDSSPFQSSFLGELQTAKWGLLKTQWLRGSTKTTVHIDNQAVVSALRRGIEAFTTDRRCARVFAWICENESFCSFSFLPGTLNQVADQLSRLIPPMTKKKTQVDWIENRILERPSTPTRNRIIAEGHHGHWSPEKTRKNIEMQFGKWPGMDQDVKEFCRKCEQCQYHGGLQTRDNFSEELVEYINDKVFADWAGPLTTSSGERRYLLIMVDAASRWLEVLDAPSPSATRSVSALQKWTAKTHSSIKTLVTDNAQIWSSSMVRNWANSQDTFIRHSPSYFPRGVNLAERMVGTLVGRLKKMTDPSPGEWQDHLEEAVLQINKSWHSALSTSPFELFYGQDRTGRWIPAAEWFAAWEKARHMTRIRKEDEQERFLKKHGRFSRPLAPGDAVLLLDSLFASRRPYGKLNRKWSGPLTIYNQNSQTTWWVWNPDFRSVFLAHSSQLRPFVR